MSYRKVAPVQDGDGHWYVIPYELFEEFYELVDDCEKEEEFVEKFSGYMTGGCLTLVDLYIKEEI